MVRGGGNSIYYEKVERERLNLYDWRVIIRTRAVVATVKVHHTMYGFCIDA